MCQDKECHMKNNCYRFMAVTSEYVQSYFTEYPRDKEKGECTCFIDCTGRRIRTTNNEQ